MLNFEFELCPVGEIEPWVDGQGRDPHLSWFGFSFGYYRIKVGSEYLLNYSDRIRAHWAEEYPASSNGPFVDYPVVRLWEDVFDILPDVLRPVPKPISSFLKQDRSVISAYCERVWEWEKTQDETAMPKHRMSDIVEAAVDWIGCRTLDTGYLTPASHIWMWSSDETVNIAWDNRGLEVDGIPAWSSQRGNHCLQRKDFLAAVRSFNDRFIQQMANRVTEICETWENPEVRVDFEGLKSEQVDRAEWLERSLERGPLFTRPWDAVIDSMRVIQSV